MHVIAQVLFRQEFCTIYWPDRQLIKNGACLSNTGFSCTACSINTTEYANLSKREIRKNSFKQLFLIQYSLCKQTEILTVTAPPANIPKTLTLSYHAQVIKSFKSPFLLCGSWSCSCPCPGQEVGNVEHSPTASTQKVSSRTFNGWSSSQNSAATPASRPLRTASDVQILLPRWYTKLLHVLVILMGNSLLTFYFLLSKKKTKNFSFLLYWRLPPLVSCRGNRCEHSKRSLNVRTESTCCCTPAAKEATWACAARHKVHHTCL